MFLRVVGVSVGVVRVGAPSELPPAAAAACWGDGSSGSGLGAARDITRTTSPTGDPPGVSYRAFSPENSGQKLSNVETCKHNNERYYKKFKSVSHTDFFPSGA
jgi:hypothetical protein